MSQYEVSVVVKFLNEKESDFRWFGMWELGKCPSCYYYYFWKSSHEKRSDSVSNFLNWIHQKQNDDYFLKMHQKHCFNYRFGKVPIFEKWNYVASIFLTRVGNTEEWVSTSQQHRKSPQQHPHARQSNCIFYNISKLKRPLKMVQF